MQQRKQNLTNVLVDVWLTCVWLTCGVFIIHDFNFHTKFTFNLYNTK